MSEVERRVPLYDFKKLAEDLKDATITYTGEVITIQCRSRDRTTYELKKALSHAVRLPVHFMFVSKQGFKQEWWLHGSPHNPFGGPALQTITDNAYLEHYYDKHGWAHCAHGPAKIEHVYGKSFNEEWIIDGETRHRIGGPAVTSITYELNQSAKTHFNERVLSWYRNGKCTNDDGWANQQDDYGFEVFETIPDKGLMRTLRVSRRTIRWYDENEKPHRNNGPAVITFTDLIEIEKPGNPIVWRWGDWSSSWWIHGTEIPNGKIIKWAQRNRILMWNEPCYDRSAFRTPEGEVSFMSEFGMTQPN